MRVVLRVWVAPFQEDPLPYRSRIMGVNLCDLSTLPCHLSDRDGTVPILDSPN